MPYEALAWTLIVLLGPTLARELSPRFEKIGPWWFELAGWIHAVWVPFLAVIFGSISARSAGLLPFDLASWLPGLLACALGFLAAASVRRILPHPAQTYGAPSDIILFEPRWALYRAAAALWIDDFTLSVGAGLLLGALEWALERRLWERAPVSLKGRSRLLRLAFSSLLFWGTRNLWFTTALQLGLILLLQKPHASAPSPAAQEAQDGRKISEA